VYKKNIRDDILSKIKCRSFNMDKPRKMFKKICILIIAVLWIAFLAVLQPHKRWGEDDTEKVSQAEKTTSTTTTTAPPARITNKFGMEFVFIHPGNFMMGSPPDEPGRYDRENLHQVKLTRGFYMQTTEVTQGQWEAVMKGNPSYFKDCGKDCPVEQVSWNDIQRFVWRLNQLEGINRYSLPTEAEWEYACRAGTQTPFNWGDEADCTKANYGVGFIRHECKEINPGKPVKVASYPPNPWGLYDMHGNVWEWCLDRFDLYLDRDMTDPVGGYAMVDRVYRGGSWGVASRYCRSANRDGGNPNDRLSELGFRLIRSLSRYGRQNGGLVPITREPFP
jgi:formylglycine-generating enzyme required for sulfatase activity